MSEATNMGGPKAVNLLTADEIFAVDDVEYVDVPMPEWSKGEEVRSVRLRTLTHDELMAYTDEIKDPEKAKQGNVLIVVRSAVKADGSPLFTHAQAAGLRMKSAKAFSRLARAAIKLNGVRQQEVEAAKND